MRLTAPRCTKWSPKSGAKAETVWKQWDLVDREEIFHYTPVDAAYRILNDCILWSSDVLSMNDGSEFRYAVSIVDDVLISRWHKLPIHVAEYFRPRTLLRLGSTWDMFAACFCSEADLLGQWRAYAADCHKSISYALWYVFQTRLSARHAGCA